MSVKPLFSVVIPTYNHAHLIRRCLDSVLSQSFTDWEAIIINNFSKDNTIEIVDSYNDPRIRLINYTNNGVIAVSRNKGIKEAQGDWICFLDSDDSWYYNKLEVCKKFINDFDLIYHSLLTNYGEEKSNEVMLLRSLDHDVFRDLMLNGNPIPNSSVCIRKELLLDLGGLSEDRSLIAVEDFDLWIRASLQNCRFKFIPSVLGEYWAGGGNISSSGLIRMDRAMIVYNQYLKHLLPADIRRHKAITAYRYGITLHKENKKKAVKKYKEAFFYGNLVIKIQVICRLLFGLNPVKFWKKVYTPLIYSLV